MKKLGKQSGVVFHGAELWFDIVWETPASAAKREAGKKNGPKTADTTKEPSKQPQRPSRPVTQSLGGASAPKAEPKSFAPQRGPLRDYNRGDVRNSGGGGYGNNSTLYTGGHGRDGQG